MENSLNPGWGSEEKVSLNHLKERLRQIPSEGEIDVLLEFMFQFTIVLRGAKIAPPWRWRSKSTIEVAMINEIHHRLLNRVRDLRNGEKWSSADYVPDMVIHHVKQAPMIAKYVGAALERALANQGAGRAGKREPE